MSYIEGTPFANIPKDPQAEGRPVLNPRISGRGLRRAYREMAKLLLDSPNQSSPGLELWRSSVMAALLSAKDLLHLV
jgi:hypothetical protein